ncbi:uncharacterized protein BDZ99DRAFT_439527 [Mytilinidion resinicola]|uniref:Histone acetyltransferase n=1 Tax=Mytilinidion resinicola TaxID=574789 RepID=A0A6A6YTX0_9PEZI|nr:uncharacterized protein BDZ99DRAFT_439527 [Mytilinidion resinicola]KAF2812406.1 hypothetical protein BDZ99DRAFT_439527 [Mytilinidion resinicola]
MAEPSRLLGQGTNANDLEDSDLDGEHEEDDVDMDAQAHETTPGGDTTDAEGSDEDAEGEDDEEAGDPVGAVKISANNEASEEEDGEDEDNDAEVDMESESDAKPSDSEGSDSSSESEAGNEWEAASDAAEEVETEIADPNRCVFCGEDEEHDPGEEFEEYLACAVCGDNGALSSVPKLARDLLPAHRGVDKPGQHSVFNDLILPDDPMDGSRSLRKRKASNEEEPAPVRPLRKKRRPSEEISDDEAVDASLAASSPRAVRIAVSEAIETDDGHHTGAEETSPKRSSRARSSRSKVEKKLLAWTVDSPGVSLIVAFHLDNERLQKILSTKPKKKRIRDRSRKTQQVVPEEPEVSHYPAIQNHYATPFYALAEKDVDETKNKPYGGILSEADADTSKTYPGPADRKRFEEARQKAEEDWKQKQVALYGIPEASSRAHKVSGPPSKIKCISFGGWEIDTWHAAPYPEEYSKNRVLYICEFCLKYMNSDYVAWRHKLKCPSKHPPGDEIYRDKQFSFFEVDGRKNPVYCQNLCLLAKLFLGSKTLYYDVEPFLFYVMTENNDFGCHFVGYFSKEKRPSSLNNVSCILVLPIHQRKGYGQFLIEFSYLLTRKEEKTGSPEKPLSDMGLVTYRNYWRLVLCNELKDQRDPISITTISKRTGMTPDDIISALEGLRALVRDPITKTYALRLDYAFFKQHVEKANARNHPRVKEDSLVWTPYVMSRNNISQYEDGPAIHTVQPRDEEQEDGDLVPEEGVQMALAKQVNGSAGGASRPMSNTGSQDNEADDGDPMTPFLDSIAVSTLGTPLANGNGNAATPPTVIAAYRIPPTRFEVYPPPPGMPAPKRRAGRPFGARRRPSTPAKRNSVNVTPLPMPLGNSTQISPSRNGTGKAMGKASPLLNGVSNGVSTPSTTVRRTRSKLHESVNGLGFELSLGLGETPEDEGGEVRVNGTSAASASPRTTRGRGKVIEMEADEDLDAEGEEEPLDMVMADA